MQIQIGPLTVPIFPKKKTALPPLHFSKIRLPDLHFQGKLHVVLPLSFPHEGIIVHLFRGLGYAVPLEVDIVRGNRFYWEGEGTITLSLFGIFSNFLQILKPKRKVLWK